jgi:hypothetical protein
VVLCETSFDWITAGALRGRPGIVDKYVGDETAACSRSSSIRGSVRRRRADRPDINALLRHLGIATGSLMRHHPS